MASRSWLDALQAASLESEKAETRGSHASLADEQEIAQVEEFECDNVECLRSLGVDVLPVSQ
jgi:hypothetical protein